MDVGSHKYRMAKKTQVCMTGWLKNSAGTYMYRIPDEGIESVNRENQKFGKGPEYS